MDENFTGHVLDYYGIHNVVFRAPSVTANTLLLSKSRAAVQRAATRLAAAVQVATHLAI